MWEHLRFALKLALTIRPWTPCQLIRPTSIVTPFLERKVHQHHLHQKKMGPSSHTVLCHTWRLPTSPVRHDTTNPVHMWQPRTGTFSFRDDPRGQRPQAKDTGDQAKETGWIKRSCPAGRAWDTSWSSWFFLLRNMLWKSHSSGTDLEKTPPGQERSWPFPHSPVKRHWALLLSATAL